MIERGEAVVLPVVPQCHIFTKEVKIKENGEDKMITMEKGPCSRIISGKCEAYINPSSRWRLGNCGLATHIIFQEDEEKFKLNPIKASKRG